MGAEHTLFKENGFTAETSAKEIYAKLTTTEAGGMKAMFRGQGFTVGSTMLANMPKTAIFVGCIYK